MCVLSHKQNSRVSHEQSTKFSQPSDTAVYMPHLSCIPHFATAISISTWANQASRCRIYAAPHIMTCAADVFGSPDCDINAQGHLDVELTRTYVIVVFAYC